jgi:Glycosyl transferase family 11.
MFIVALEGGLGNQMFEYAFYLALKEAYPKEDIKADLSFISSKMHNGYELEKIFGINPPTCTKYDIIRYSDYYPEHKRGGRTINFLLRIRRTLFGRKASCLLQPDATEFIEEYFKLDKGKDYYFKGVWANELYFRNIKKEIREAFIFPPIYDSENSRWYKLIRELNSVSVHFRGGDYYKTGYSVLGKDYYDKAFEYIEQNLADVTYFVFTDDERHAYEIFGKNNRRYCFIKNNQGKMSYIDMQLMSICRHNIIANSTFSFWGAYLNNNAGKIVIAPKQPVRGCKFPYQSKGWVLL